MLQNVFYTLTSGMAQVWAALMVFQILLVRESATRHHEIINQQWKIARKWWGPLLTRLQSRDPAVKERLGRYGLSEDLLSTAHTDTSSFIQVIQAISRHRIVIGEGQGSGPLNGYDLSPGDWQKIFDPVAQKVEQASTETVDPVRIFYVGCFGIGLNFVSLTLSSLSLFGSDFLPVLFAIACGGNLLLAGTFILQVRKLLR